MTVRAGRLTLASVVALWIGLSACARPVATPASPQAAPTLTLFVSADLRGYLAPCGCSENMRGGIARAAHQVLEARRDAPGRVFYVDGGNSLFSSARLTAAQRPQEERKARALAEAFSLMKLDARAVGERDGALGEAFRESLQLPELTSGHMRLFQNGGATIGIAAGSDLTSLQRAARSAKASGARFVVGLFTGTFTEAQRLAAEAGPHGLPLDLIVASHAEGEADGEENRLIRSTPPVARVQSKGRSLMRIDVAFGPRTDSEAGFELLTTGDEVAQSLQTLSDRIALSEKQLNQPGLSEESRALRREKLAELVRRRESLADEQAPELGGRDAFSVRFIALDAVLPSAPEGRAIVERYDRDVGKLNLAWAQQHGEDCPPATPEEPGFVGNAPCLACHPQAGAVYEKTKHAHAYETLQTQGKGYHLDCVGCHVTGWQRPDGVCRVDKVEDRASVGCESCHGPGSRHVVEPVKETIRLGNAPQACVGCHDPENSPHFDFAQYLPVILGPGHGRPAAESPADGSPQTPR